MRLALFIGDLIQSYESNVLEEFTQLVKRKGIRVDVFANCFVPFSDYLHIEGLKSVFYLPDLSRYDGIIIADDTLHNYNMNIELRERLKREAECPVVSLRNAAEDWHFIQSDNAAQMESVAEHLYHKHGCRRIGFVTGLITQKDAQERLEGYKNAAKRLGITVSEQDIFYGNYWTDQGDETAEFYINREGGLPEAVICSNDYMALALIEAFARRNIRVPEDVIVTGVDNIPEGRDNVPSLTTVDLPVGILVEEAVNTIEKLNAGETLPKRITIPNKLIYRCSCGCENAREAMIDNYHLMKNAVEREGEKGRDCVYMSIDFGGVIDENDCIRWALTYFKKAKLYLKSYIVLNGRLKAASRFDWDPDILDKPVEKGNLLPDGYEEELEGGCNVFFPINCKDEVYGYMAAQLDPEHSGYFDEVIAQLLITIGNTFKRLEMMRSLGEAENIMKLYLQDPMTELYNRRGFERRMRDLYEHGAKDIHVAVASIDMDRLKYINDNFGHFEGDRAIRAVSDCISDVLREGEFAARFGGDEFAAVMLLGEGESKDDFRKRLYKRIEEVSGRFPDYKLSISVGMADVRSYGSTLEGLREADSEMYREKKLHHLSMESQS